VQPRRFGPIFVCAPRISFRARRSLSGNARSRARLLNWKILRRSGRTMFQSIVTLQLVFPCLPPHSRHRWGLTTTWKPSSCIPVIAMMLIMAKSVEGAIRAGKGVQEEKRKTGCAVWNWHCSVRVRVQRALLCLGFGLRMLWLYVKFMPEEGVYLFRSLVPRGVICLLN
jgi:hypothetical protein